MYSLPPIAAASVCIHKIRIIVSVTNGMLSKAYDIVKFKTLLNKLYGVGIHGIAVK